MLNPNKNIREELSELDNIFEKISNKYKKQSDEFLFSSTLKEYLMNPEKRYSKVKETIENDASFNIEYPECFLRRGNNKDIDIKFLVKAKFIDENKESFSFWVCSFEFLKEALRALGYLEAKIIKKKKILFSENEEMDKDKDSSGSSSESLGDKSTLDIDLAENEVRVSKNPFSLERTFDKAQNNFNPIFSNDNLEDYLYDIDLPKKFNKTKFVCNGNYLIFLNDIFTTNFHHNHFYCYNAKSGLTLCLLQILEQKRKRSKIRYFHFNSEYIKKYKKKYIYFKLAKLFQKDEKSLYKEIANKISKKIRKYDIQAILTEIIKNLNDIYIIFDNIKENSILIEIKKIITNLEYLETENNNKFTILKFIEINSDTFFWIFHLNYFSTIFPNENSYKQLLPVDEYVKTLSCENEKDKIDVIEKYKINTKSYIFGINNNNSIEYLIFLFKLLHINTYTKNNNFLDYNYNIYLISFLPYLYISLYNTNYFQFSIDKIQFRGNFIKEMVYDLFVSLISEKILTENIFRELKNKSTEGIYLEKEIIYHLVTKNIAFEKISIEKIYCFNSKIEKNITKSEIIFIQELERAPIYDFGIIIDNEGEPVFKGYQIGINKPRYSLANLSKERIKMDILYFISKINKFLNKKITKFSFGIITTINAYFSNSKIDFNIDTNYIEINDFAINEDNNKEENDNEYKNYKTMKKHCNENNFEFILFDPKDKIFYIEDEKSDLKIITFNKYLDSNKTNNVTNYIFSNEDELNIIKIPLYPNEITKSDQKIIYESINDIKDKKLNFIGKFGKEKKNIKSEAIKGRFEITKGINFDNLINENYIIYAKDKNNKKTIFFNKKYFCNEYQDINIFYVFDASINLNKRGNNKNANNSESIKNNINFSSIIENKNLENNNNFIGKKKKSEELDESEDDLEKEDDESSKK